MALIYFTLREARARSRLFYRDLRNAALTKDANTAERVTRQMMIESLDLWQAALDHQGGSES
jgi:DNA-binding FadR family transcriptional regulator